jgi:hypothetical protein
MSEKTKIYVAVTSSARTTLTIATALAEDGNVLARQEAPSLTRAQHALGITSGHMHDVYAKAYPNGYELEFVGEPQRHEGYQAAFLRGAQTRTENVGAGQEPIRVIEVVAPNATNTSIVDDLDAIDQVITEAEQEAIPEHCLEDDCERVPEEKIRRVIIDSQNLGDATLTDAALTEVASTPTTDGQQEISLPEDSQS